MRVLVVDDHDDARELLAIALEMAGAQVTQADSVRAAISALASGEFEVLVSDIGMPGEDGYDLMRRLRDRVSPTQKHPIPAVAVTAFDSREDRLKALAVGFQEHISKPVDVLSLVAVVARLAAMNGNAATSATSIPRLEEWWPGWCYRVRQAMLRDEHALEELRVALHGEGIDDMEIPRHDTPGAYVVEDTSGVVGALLLRGEYPSYVYVKATHRQRGVGLIALGIVAEQYFAKTNVPALGTAPLTAGAKALAQCICDPGRRYLTLNRWLAVVRPRVLQRLGSVAAMPER